MYRKLYIHQLKDIQRLCLTAAFGYGVQVAYKQLGNSLSESLGSDGVKVEAKIPSDSFDQDHVLPLPGLGLLGAVVRAFGVGGAGAAQVQEAEASLQAEALLGAGCGADVVVVVSGGSVVQIPLRTFSPITCSTGEGR